MSFKIVAGDFSKDTMFIDLLGKTGLIENKIFIDFKSQLEKVELVTEENQKKFLGSAGWGLIGGLAGFAIAGPIPALVGGLAGVLKGGNKKEICVACYLKDGRKLMALTTVKQYQKLTAFSFNTNR